mgnify:CR=1 FL=1
MDINDARAATTVLSLILFVGIMVWTWSRRRRGGFDQAGPDRVEPLAILGRQLLVLGALPEALQALEHRIAALESGAE